MTCLAHALPFALANFCLMTGHLLDFLPPHHACRVAPPLFFPFLFFFFSSCPCSCPASASAPAQLLLSSARCSCRGRCSCLSAPVHLLLCFSACLVSLRRCVHFCVQLPCTFSLLCLALSLRRPFPPSAFPVLTFPVLAFAAQRSCHRASRPLFPGACFRASDPCEHEDGY